MGFTKQQLEHGLKSEQLSAAVPNGMSIMDMIKTTTGDTTSALYTEESGSAKTDKAAISPGTTTPRASKAKKTKKTTRQFSSHCVILILVILAFLALVLVVTSLM